MLSHCRELLSFFSKQIWLLFADSCPQTHRVVAFYLICQVHIGVQKSSSLLPSKPRLRWTIYIWHCSNYTVEVLSIHYYFATAAFSVQQNTLFVFLGVQVAVVRGKKPWEAGICVSRRLEKGEGSLCHWHISNDMPGIKGEYNLIKCLLTDSLANREAA